MKRGDWYASNADELRMAWNDALLLAANVAVSLDGAHIAKCILRHQLPASGTEAGTGETPLRLDPKGDGPVPERQTPNSSPKAYRE